MYEINWKLQKSNMITAVYPSYIFNA